VVRNQPLADFRLDGHVAIVTGAAGGLGSAIARCLASAGAHVAVAEQPARIEEARRLAGALSREHGVRALGVAMDVLDVDGIEQATAQIEMELGPPDVLVANAGVIIRKPSLEVTEDDWDRVVDVDLKGVFFTCQAAGKRMVARGRGSIVAISSQNGLVGQEERAAYCAAKAGVVNLVRVLALEWAPHGVRVNAVGPTFVETPLTRQALANPKVRQDIVSRIPLGRLGMPDEVANAVLFLASPAASLITGTCLLADGGWTAM
jgi:2-dehydro-3-deoxy-D-gluconate 5-dehydrogenase